MNAWKGLYLLNVLHFDSNSCYMLEMLFITATITVHNPLAVVEIVEVSFLFVGVSYLLGIPI